MEWKPFWKLLEEAYRPDPVDHFEEPGDALAAQCRDSDGGCVHLASGIAQSPRTDRAGIDFPLRQDVHFVENQHLWNAGSLNFAENLQDVGRLRGGIRR